MIFTTSWVLRADRARCAPMAGRVFFLFLVSLQFFGAGWALAAEGVSVIDVNGTVEVKTGPQAAFSRVRVGDRIGHGARIRTGETGKVVLRFADGTTTRMMPKTEALIRAPRDRGKRPNSVVLFFGRLWTDVVKTVSGEETFEVRAANAVAGVRGTQFEVGVADDGSTLVVVSEGQVDVAGDVGRKKMAVRRGYQVESSPRGRLLGRRKSPKTLDWNGWFARRAQALEKRGRAIAKNLHGRLDRRRQQVERLVSQQKKLREDIEGLEARRRKGADVDEQLQAKLRRLERVTERLEDMQRRLQAAFGIFGMWGRKAADGDMPNARQIGLLAEDVKRVERGFMDLFEEGTDLSEEGMEEMMEDMRKGPTLKPKKSVKEELF